MASSIGSHYRCSVFGESHGEMIGVEIDGMPPGEAIDEADMARRAPGSSKLTPQRKEADAVHLATGVMNGVTTGFPLLAYILNTNQRSKDYSNLLDHPRPSHADYTAYVHYKGFADMRGGGHFSGRLTAPLCIAGGIAKQILRRRGIYIGAQLLQVAEVRGTAFDFPRGQDVILSYPYESMQPFLRLVRRAANDPSVTSIQITIYRLAKEAKLIDSLCLAAENGKEVLVLIELRARFDEQNNIDWSERLETAGCRVIYGFEGFKVHSKVCLITRLEHGNPRYVTQIATGNYNEKTAAQYTDLSLITADQNIGRDAAEFFRNMSIGNLDETYKHLMVAPNCMKSRIMELIDEEIKKGKDGQIIFKVNSVTDLEVINKLSEASCAGVRIMMLVRGICCLLPGVPGHTENIRVFSIVGRYLEHSRIYSFGAGSEQKLYISSADLMTRNMQRRVEVAVPIYAPHIRERINHILDVYFRDTAKARELKSDGNYERFPEYKTGLSAQEQFMAEALENADTEKPHTEGWLHRKVREKVTRWYRSLTSDLD